jgi:hypothetical protein
VSILLPTLLVLGQLPAGHLGVSLEGVSINGVRQPIIVGVERGGPAARAGLVVGDAIVTIGGAPVGSVERVREMIHDTPAASTVKLGVLRFGPRYFRGDAKGQLIEVTARLDAAPDLPPPPPPPEPRLVQRQLVAFVAPHANAAETEQRWADVDMSSTKQKIARLLQEALMREGVQIVTDPRIADVVLTPTTESHRSSRGNLLMDARYTVRAEARGVLVDSFSVDYEMDFDRMSSDDLSRQDREHARKMAYAIVSAPSVARLAVTAR